MINLTDEITYSVYMYTARGLFERDKLIFLAQVAFQVMRANVWGFCCIILYVRLCWLRQVVLLLPWCCWMLSSSLRSPSCHGRVCQGGCDAALSPCQVLAIKKEVNPAELDFLLRFPSKAGVASPVDFLQPQGWGGIKVGPSSCPLCRGEASTAPSTVGTGSPVSPAMVCRAPPSPAAGETRHVPAPGRGSGTAACQRRRGLQSALRQAVGSAIQPTQRQRQPVPLLPIPCPSRSPQGWGKAEMGCSRRQEVVSVSPLCPAPRP